MDPNNAVRARDRRPFPRLAHLSRDQVVEMLAHAAWRFSGEKDL
jgi:hypothetical protein